MKAYAVLGDGYIAVDGIAILTLVTVGLAVHLLAALCAFALSKRGTLSGRVDVGRVLEDVSVELVVELERAVEAASLAALRNSATLD